MRTISIVITNIIDNENDLKPNIENLLSKHQAHPSHERYIFQN